MAKCKTFLDANIVITAFGGLPSHRLSDRMEAARAKAELQFMLEFFAGPVEEIPASSAITGVAVDLACRYGLGAMDALHISAAISAGADEFVTSDQKLQRVREIKVALI